MCLFGYFVYAEFISAQKTKPKSTVVEKHGKNGKEIFIIIIFYFLLFSVKVSSKNV